ncbi:MAG: flagellar filament capping protein FliD [Balneolaceae bacterium]|nr:flagellar filament capping protein FliD [Balneolaceae bacterium]
MISTSALTSQTNPYESTIRQLLQLEGQKKLQLQQDKSAVTKKQTALSDIDSKLSSLNSLMESFADPTGDTFSPLTGSSSNDNAVSVVSAGGIDNPGSYNIEISQLAKQDLVTSDAFSDGGSELAGSGSGSFELTVGTGGPITINVDTTGLTNDEVLQAVADEVEAQAGEQVDASVYAIGDGTSRLSFKSLETGEASRLSIANASGDLTGINLANEYTTDELNAKFTVDNIDFERSSNLVNDVVNGLTFELNQTTTAIEEINVSRDTEAAVKKVEEFVTKFNEVNSIIRNKTFLNGETGDRGVLQDERAIRNLSLSLRQEALLPVDSLNGSDISSLSDIGIDFQQDGTMEIADMEKLKDTLATKPSQVGDLFSADTDGIATVLNQTIEAYITGTDSIFSGIEESFDRKIDRFDDRIAAEDDYLIRKEEQLRDEFARLNQAITRGQYQYNQVLNFQSKLGLGG